MRHKVSGIFICEVEGNTRKEVMIETARAVQEGRAKLHVMEVEDERKTKKKPKEAL